MKLNKDNIKDKNLKQIAILIISIMLLILIGYIQLLNKNDSSNNIQNENKTTNTIDRTDVNIGIEDIPQYSDQIVININNDVPYFEDNDMTTENFENYSKLDEFKRAGVAYANICKYTMPPEGTKRGSISYKPTGWVQYLYGNNNSKHLYERCHLIAWQLGNENNNDENIIANWIKQKNKQGKDYHILYRVTPIYNGKNKLAMGIEIEAKSVEEEGVSFNKFIYNVQDNFEIDYSTGKAKLIE